MGGIVRARTSAYRIRILTVLLALGVVAAACGGDDAEETTTTAAPATTTTAAPAEPEPLTVGMALPGPKNDKGFSQAHYNGLLLVESEMGVKVSVRENVLDPQARVEALRDLAQDNELVIGVGAEYAEPGVTVAPQFPDTTFMVINGQTSDAPNLFVYGVREGVPAYIAGVVAAHLTTSNQAGFVGGEEIPPLYMADDGFSAGLKSVNPDIEITSTIVGSFIDPQGAFAAASAQLAVGADVIYSYVDSGIAGVIEAIGDAGGNALTFGIIFPRCGDFPEIVGTSILNASGLVLTMTNDYVNGTVPDVPQFFGVENPDVQRFELCPDHVTDELRKIVDDTTAGINDGSITLPEGI